MKIYHCDLEITLDIIGGKWKSLILYYLLKDPKRTGELKRLIPSITQKMLVQTLRELETDGMINRKSYNQVPPKVEYSATELGKSLEPIMRELCKWGGSYANQHFIEGEFQIMNLD
ncbi:hypothetical protein SY83_19945 [Paenibacillus swuensis]|uniref:HTH hxlR-type domain-containing protein n=1 Tax=Paenibacillus swuensis TaxID=1178515 RepID=A0A172TMZ0_9BACL|nr:winged helix-turn-helix transcriptional regulator [Paenibacillus swuensis]ANE48187.1 hypothetical protein SY83_19945 [Paenibacillus swuensis]